ncbi:MAG: gliding motility-associated C-terminal domain-containing protein [Elusimicrobia bacterium]|nr:gliding motility-associated C-terminal domain-containing protein [Elusimicrobiota bacterium]
MKKYYSHGGFSSKKGASIRKIGDLVLTIRVCAILVALGLGWTHHSQAASFGTARLMVTLLAPDGLVITHIPQQFVYFADYLTINASVAAPAGNGVARVLLHYRQKGRVDYVTATGGNAFTPVPSGRRNYTGRAIIPGNVLAGSGVEYYIEAFDLSNRPSYAGTPAAPLFSRLAGQDLIAAGTYAGDLGVAGGALNLPDGATDDGNTSIQVNSGFLPQTYTFTITQKDKNNPSQVPTGSGQATGRAAVAYTFGGGPVPLPGMVRISLLYADVDSTPGMVDGTSIDETHLRLFYWDGAAWRLVGGSVNPDLDTVTAMVPRLGLYALFEITDFSPKIYAPEERVFTPNGDGINDKLMFDGLSGNFEIKIFDETGQLIRVLREPEWDGRDTSGRTVDNGLYVYQYVSELGSEWVSGVVAVAK